MFRRMKAVRNSFRFFRTVARGALAEEGAMGSATIGTIRGSQPGAMVSNAPFALQHGAA
jgi:hypothetical protein